MRRITLAAAVSLLAAACGGDGAATTSTMATTTTTGITATTAVTTTTASTASTAIPTGPTDCTEIWPEALVQEVAGSSVEFFAANEDDSACTYLGDTGGIALAWRTSTFDDYEEGRTGTSAGAPTVDQDVCDAAYSTELAGSTLIMEAYSEAKARTFAATISGINPEDALAWASELLASAC
jgi:hypothetical protein